MRPSSAHGVDRVSGTDSAGRADRRAHEYDSRQRRGALCAKPLHLRGSRHPVEAWRGQGAHGPATAGGTASIRGVGVGGVEVDLCACARVCFRCCGVQHVEIGL
eukprot:742944-Rhodomonas_salina.3